MGYFPVRYNSRVVIYEHKMFIRLATGLQFTYLHGFHQLYYIQRTAYFLYSDSSPYGECSLDVP